MNKVKGLALCLALVFAVAMFADQVDDWLWVNSAGGYFGDYGYGITIDSLGNSYVTGSFSGTANFGPYTAVSNGDRDIYVAKMDRNGNWIWVQTAGGTYEDEGFNITLDNAGFIYVTGIFRGTAIFGSTTLNNGSGRDIFIAKISSDGNWIFAVDSGTANYYDRVGIDIGVDLSGNIYAAGYEGYCALCVKISPDGTITWVRTSSSAYACATSIAVSNDGTTYISGRFSDIINFGTISLSTDAYNGYSGFITAIDSNGNWLWAVTNEGSGYIEYAAIDLDSQGSCYVTGSFNGVVEFGTQTLQNTYDNYIDVFVAKYNHDVGWIWASAAGGLINDAGMCIASDQFNGGCYVAGYYMDTSTFGNESIGSIGSSDIFISKLDISGNWIKTRHAGSSPSEIIEEIAIDNSGTCYVVGSYEGPSSIGNHNLPFAGISDIVIAKTHFYDLEMLSANTIDFTDVYITVKS